jgi:hypothetical protein
LAGQAYFERTGVDDDVTCKYNNGRVVISLGDLFLLLTLSMLEEQFAALPWATKEETRLSNCPTALTQAHQCQAGDMIIAHRVVLTAADFFKLFE